MKIHPIEAEYIEKGTFQGGEEDASIAGIKYDETVIVLKRAEFDALLAAARAITLVGVATNELLRPNRDRVV